MMHKYYSTIELNQYIQAVIDSFLFSKTDTNGIITDVNDSFCESVGYTKKELLGNTHSIIRHPDMKNIQFYVLWKTILSKNIYKHLIKNRSKEGHTIYHNTTIVPILDENGQIKEFIALRHDATGEMNAVNQLSKTISTLYKKDQMLMHQSKLAQMGEMINMIAHQWRQPLSAISATTSDLDTKIELGAYDSQYFIEKIKKMAYYTDHLSETIDDFRNFFRQDKEKKVVTFEEVVNSALNIIGVSLKNKNIHIHSSFQSSKHIFVFPSELQQVVLNILKNAEDAILEAGRSPGHLYISSYDVQTMTCLNIEDNGGGVPLEVQSKIFEAYYSTKKQKDGTGLGLHMSKIIIEDHSGGKLSVKNTSTGAIFTICLPPLEYDKSHNLQ